MKIMYVLHESGNSFNGASRSALSLIKYASEHGDSVYVVLPTKEGRIVDELERLQKVVIIEGNYLPWKRKQSTNSLKRFIKRLLYYGKEKREKMKIAKKIAEYAIQEEIDIIHSNSSVVDIGGLIHKYTGIPHVWHVREFGEEDFDMYPMDTEKSFYRFIYDNSNRIICISEAVKKKIESKMPPDRTVVVYNGVDIPENAAGNHVTGNILISGVISKKKGQWIAVEAVDILKHRGIDVNLYIAGKGDLSTLGESYDKNKEYIHVLGFIDDMQSLRSSMDIELMCSVSEAFGRTTVEAMAAGLLIIAADGGASPELISDGENGFLFEVNNPVSLADRIQMVLCMNEKEKTVIRNRGFESARMRYNKEAYISNVRKVYDEVMGEAK